MTVSIHTTYPVEGDGNGSDTVFSGAPMFIYETTDIAVTHVVISTGVETALTEGTGASNYSVAAATSFPGSFNVTYPADEVTPMTTDEKIIITYSLPLEQALKLLTITTYDAEALMIQLDKIIQLMIQQQGELDRALKIALSVDPDADLTIPALLNNAGKVLTVDSDELGISWSTVSSTDADASDATPQAVSLTTPAAGSGADFSRDDHVHKLTPATATQRLIGRNTAAAGNWEEVTLTQLLDWISGSVAQGDILYRGAASWARLAAGTSGEFLQTQGAGANPQWASSAAVGADQVTLVLGPQVWS